jgi:hypothetical protein
MNRRSSRIDTFGPKATAGPPLPLLLAVSGSSGHQFREPSFGTTRIWA